MNATSNPYREYLRELAESRGLDGVEELVERLRDAGHSETARTLLGEAGPEGYFGRDLDDVLGLSEVEKMRVSGAWWETFVGPSPS